MDLQKKDRTIAVDALQSLLANTYVLAVKIQNFHWNVEDSRFYMLHNFFSLQYDSLIEAIDEIAERIRMLGEYVAGSMTTYLKIATIQEAKTSCDGNFMLRELTKDHQEIISMIRKSIECVSATKDQGSLDFLIVRLQEHEKMAWIAGSHCKGILVVE